MSNIHRIEKFLSWIGNLSKFIGAMVLLLIIGHYFLAIVFYVTDSLPQQKSVEGNKYNKMDDLFSEKSKVMKLERKVTDEEYNHMTSQYDGGIAYLDFHLGKLFAQLKKLGLYDNTLIIITSDHGEVFGRRNLLEHGVSVYQDQVYVPLIIKYPNIKKKHVVGELTSSIDLMPTILDVLNYDIPEQVQGQSLLNQELEKSKSVISESFPYGYLLNWHSKFDRIERAIFSGPYKFISSTAGKKELYNLLQDPNEKKDLYTAENNIAIDLETKLNRWIEDVKAKSGSTAKSKVDKDTLNRLKALGYVQ